MSEAPPQMLEEVYESANILRGSLLGSPRASMKTLWSSNSRSTRGGSPQGADRRRSSLLSSLYNALNLSTPSVRSNLFTHSWRRLGTYNIPDLCSYIEFTPPTPITRLRWCKNQDGVKHEFLLLKVERPDDGKTVWLRLDRRVHENARAVNAVFSPVPSGDTVRICSYVSRLFDASRSQVQVETEFAIPPLLQRLGNLLTILMEDSPDYKLYSENCYFFCAVIYENLVSMGRGVNVVGAPSRFSLSLAPELKAQIKKRMDMWPSEPPPTIPSLEFPNPLLPEWSASFASLPVEQDYVNHPLKAPEESPSISAYSDLGTEYFRLAGSQAKESSHAIKNPTERRKAPMKAALPLPKPQRPYPARLIYDKVNKWRLPPLKRIQRKRIPTDRLVGSSPPQSAVPGHFLERRYSPSPGERGDFNPIDVTGVHTSAFDQMGSSYLPSSESYGIRARTTPPDY